MDNPGPGGEEGGWRSSRVLGKFQEQKAGWGRVWGAGSLAKEDNYCPSERKLAGNEQIDRNSLPRDWQVLEEN